MGKLFRRALSACILVVVVLLGAWSLMVESRSACFHPPLQGTALHERRRELVAAIEPYRTHRTPSPPSRNPNRSPRKKPSPPPPSRNPNGSPRKKASPPPPSRNPTRSPRKPSPPPPKTP